MGFLMSLIDAKGAGHFLCNVGSVF